jgi:hypothetical protein
LKIVKIVTPYGYFQVGREKVIRIEKEENQYTVYREMDSYNPGTQIEVKTKEILVYWE